MKLWLDDIRPPPDDSWRWAKSVADAQRWVVWCMDVENGDFDECSLDHDLGQGDGLDGINFVDWMAGTSNWPKKRPIVHSMNPIGRIRMRMTINRYGPYEN